MLSHISVPLLLSCMGFRGLYKYSVGCVLDVGSLWLSSHSNGHGRGEKCSLNSVCELNSRLAFQHHCHEKQGIHGNPCLPCIYHVFGTLTLQIYYHEIQPGQLAIVCAVTCVHTTTLSFIFLIISVTVIPKQLRNRVQIVAFTV